MKEGAEGCDNMSRNLVETDDGNSCEERKSRNGNSDDNNQQNCNVKQCSESRGEVTSNGTHHVAAEPAYLLSEKRGSDHFDRTLPSSKRSIKRLQIAMLIVGTRGDVQPVLAVAKRLQEFGHRVRLATHMIFSDFVRSAGVEFYPLGGDPRVLAGYMQRNKGMPFSWEELRIQKEQFKSIMESILPACTQPDTETGAPFRAEAIIASFCTFGQVHVAEALNVPLYILFTLPWTPTSDFPQPIACLPHSPGNKLSYILVDLAIWWMIRDLVNDVRERLLKLPPIPYFSLYTGSLYHFPTGYMWSRHVLPKPKDWGPSVDVVGYCFLKLGSKYLPQEEFVDWMKKGPTPIYIGFGSMLLDDPRKTTGIILEALKRTGQRGILNRGWGDLGIFSEAPDYVYLIDDCPHDWLFPQCSSVIHHGGAGTTASGLKSGCPTTIVPFFGDQFFWGDIVHRKGLGPKPIPIAHLSTQALSDAIKFMLQPEVKSQAMEMAKLIEEEDGVATAVDSIHKHLAHDLSLLPSKLEEDDSPSIVQRFFTRIGKLCCGACS